jgi:hypothetical protein
MINNYLCEGCKKFVVCEWAKTIEKKFHEETKGHYHMTITINECQQFEDIVEIEEDVDE